MPYIDPSRENWTLFKSLPRDTPIRMLNLIKIKDLADYPEGHPNHGKGMTGREAYAIYRAGFQALVGSSAPKTQLLIITHAFDSMNQVALEPEFARQQKPTSLLQYLPGPQ